MPSQVGYFDSLKSAAGKVFSYLASITLTGTDGKTLTVEDNSYINQDLTIDSLTATFGKVTTPKVYGGQTQIGINASTPTDIALGNAFILIVRDNGNGGSAAVYYEHGQTPIINTIAGTTVFVTGVPAATQIQLANRAGDGGVSALGGSSRDTGTSLNVLVLSCQG